MFCSFLADTDQWNDFFHSPVWHTSMYWLVKNASSAELGTYSLGHDDWFVNVHQYQTKHKKYCVWESHQNTIDIQYVISGSEQILWLPTSQLSGPIKTFDNIDRQEWSYINTSPVLPSQLILFAGFFAVFLPNEGHCPMISTGDPSTIRKAVVKIPLSLIVSE